MIRKKAVVLGGGITGLTAAFYLEKWSKEKGLPLEITVVERDDRLGGKVMTRRRDGFLLERGPDSFLARKPAMLQLIKDLKLEGELVATGPKGKKSYILHKGKLHHMPQGLTLGIPTEVGPFIKTGLVSPLGKMRAALDLLLPRGNTAQDESLGDFLERRLGSEVLYQIAEPLLAGIYAGDTHSLSLQATFPQFQEMEKKHRSLIFGMMRSKKNPPPKEMEGLPEVAKRTVFLSLSRGLISIIEKLADELKGKILLGTGANRIEKREDQYWVTLGTGETLAADLLISALPAPILALLLPDVAVGERLKRIHFVSVANVILAYEADQIPLDMNGSGFLVPRTEGRTITACTWTSSKWPHTAPPGKVLLRLYVGRSGQEEWLHMDDEELLHRLKMDLRETMGITATPLFHEITRLPQSMPQYPVGHLQNVKVIREELAARYPGLYIAGSSFNGVGMPDCVRQGKEAAEEGLKYLLGETIKIG
ncbi:MAG: protoporphyrinogen oxidase [Thermicanus sp.]|nr:protoporphyrinogen oxidase [Thermicanus sp.]